MLKRTKYFGYFVLLGLGLSGCDGLTAVAGEKGVILGLVLVVSGLSTGVAMLMTKTDRPSQWDRDI